MIPVRRFQQVIGGCMYDIEASRVRDDRWRAQIARTPGVPTAMMPFYGKTADEAATLLCEWLTRAHRCPGTGRA
ncbi:MAG TPA: hypothetical protein VK911_01215 [Vicinamibacterales bacterium]|nr:hypothetical protein [Vicinamibacterales bacterium]